jgi:hypothetical protein
MESTEPRTANRLFGPICPLEWVVAATDAARRVAEREETGRFRLDYAQLYTETLAGL